MTSQQKPTPHLIKVDHCGVLCFQNIDFDSDMARAKYLLILSATCVARKKQVTPVLSVKSIWWASENTLKTKKYIRPLKKVEIRVYEKTTKSVINNVSAYSTDSITPDFRLRKGYRFLIRYHHRLQTFSKQRCLLLGHSSPTVIS